MWSSDCSVATPTILHNQHCRQSMFSFRKGNWKKIKNLRVCEFVLCVWIWDLVQFFVWCISWGFDSLWFVLCVCFSVFYMFVFFSSQCRKQGNNFILFSKKHQIENTENKFENKGNNFQTCFWVFFVLKNRKRFSKTAIKQALRERKRERAILCSNWWDYILLTSISCTMC